MITSPSLNPQLTHIRRMKIEFPPAGLFFKNISIFAPSGEMAEWSKAHAWKVCNRQKRFMGSNPILSAIFFLSYRFPETFNRIY